MKFWILILFASSSFADEIVPSATPIAIPNPSPSSSVLKLKSISSNQQALVETCDRSKVVEKPGANYTFTKPGSPGTSWGIQSGAPGTQSYTNNCQPVDPNDSYVLENSLCGYKFICVVYTAYFPPDFFFNSLQYTTGSAPANQAPSWYQPPKEAPNNPISLYSIQSGRIVESGDGIQISTNDGIPITTNGYPANTFTAFCATCGDPVSLAVGTFWHDMTDFIVKGRTPDTALSLKRTYVARSLIENGDFGKNWISNWETRIIAATPFLDTSLIWIDENGGAWTFTRNANNTFNSPNGFFGQLVEFEDHYELRKKQGVVLSFTRVATIAPVGRITKITERHGESISFSYETGLLKRISAPFAGDILYTRNTQGLVTSVLRSRDQLTYRYEYNSRGELTASVDFSFKRYSYYYKTILNVADTLLTAIVDPLSRLARFDYDQTGRVISQTDVGGGTRNFTYLTTTNGTRQTQVLEIDNTFQTFKFDTSLRLIENMQANGSKKKYTWSLQNQITSLTDENGGITETEYDSRGNLISIKKPLDAKPTKFTYDQKFDQLIDFKPTLDSSVQFSLDLSNGDVLEKRRNDGTTALSVRMAYDAFGNLKTVNNGLVTYSDQLDLNGLKLQKYDVYNPQSFIYDTRGRVAQKTDRAGRILKYSYNDYDQVTQVEDNTGPSSFFAYDIMNRLISKTTSDKTVDQIERYQWDGRDRLSKVTRADGSILLYIYSDTAQWVIDKPTKITDGKGNTTFYDYDIMQRLVRKVDAKGSVEQYRYDAKGNRVMVIDQNDHETDFAYDLNDRLIEKKETSAAATAGKNILVTQTTQYENDDQGRVLREKKISVRNPALMSVTEYKYDSLGRVSKKSLYKMNGSKLEMIEDVSDYTYALQLDQSLMISANNTVEKLGFSYASAPPFSYTGFSNLADQFKVDRDETGRVSKVSNLKGKVVLTSAHDQSGRLLTIKSGNYLGLSLGSLQTAVSYDSFGRKSSVKNSNGVNGTYQYDEMNRIKQVDWKGLILGSNLNESLVYDLAGNITNRKQGSKTETFGYDVANQLTQINGRSYEYDPSGNRTADSTVGASTYLANFLSSTAQTQYLSDSDGLGNRTQEINMKTQFVNSYDYRTDGKMTGFVRLDSKGKQEISAQYYYDALGRRVSKKLITKDPLIKSFTHSFTYLGNEDKILLSKNGIGETTIYLDGQGVDEHYGYVNRLIGFAYATDHLGSVLNGVAAGLQRSFGAFGESETIKYVSSALLDPLLYGFAGRSYDSENGLYYMRSRMYDPASGRLMTKDTIGFVSGDLNLYRYVQNIPLSYTDPYGWCGFYASYSISAIVGPLSGQTSTGAAFSSDMDGGVNATYGGSYTSAGFGFSTGFTVGYFSGGLGSYYSNPTYSFGVHTPLFGFEYSAYSDSNYSFGVSAGSPGLGATYSDSTSSVGGAWSYGSDFGIGF